MGLSYIAFACSIDAFESVYSSRDEALYERIVTSEDSAIRHYLNLDKTQETGAMVPINLAPLHEIFIGGALTQFKPHKYAYTLIACLYALGKELGESGGGYGRLYEAMSTLEQLGESGEVLPEMSTEWPFPGISVADWPMYLALRAPEVARRDAAMKEMLQRIQPTFAARAEERAAAFVEEIAQFYAECAALQQDLILVSH